MTYKLCLEEISGKELGYLLGFYIGDGYSHHNKSERQYKTTFTLNSKEVEAKKNLETTLVKMGLNPFTVKDKRFNSVMLSVNSRNFMEYMTREKAGFLSGATKSEDFCLGVISGFIDAEGYVNNGEIQLTQKNKDVLDRIVTLAESLGIERRKFWEHKNYKSSSNVWRLRISTSFKYLHHNSVKVRNHYSGEKP